MRLIFWLFLSVTISGLAKDAAVPGITINGMQVKIYLQPNEGLVSDFPPGSGQKFLKLFSKASLDVKSELWVGDREILQKRSKGLELTAKEDASFLKYAIFVTDERLSESDLNVIKATALGTARDPKEMESLNKQTLERLKKAGADVSTYDSKYMDAAKNAGNSLHLVSESKRHCTMSGQGPGFHAIVSYVIAESKMVMVVGWADLQDVSSAEARISEVVDSIESQTRKWDGVVPDLTNARFNGPDGIFSYKLFGKWQTMRSAPGSASPFPPGVKFVFLRNAEKTKAGLAPVITFVVENVACTSLDEYWEMSKKLMATKIADGSIQGVSDAKAYPVYSGWPAVTTTYQMKSERPLNCRIVMMKIGPGQFLTATLMYDETASEDLISSGMECLDSLDTPNSPKAKVLR